MSDAIKDQIMEELQAIVKQRPSLRIFQILGNVTPPAEAKRRDNDMYYVTDETLLAWLRDYPTGSRSIDDGG